MLKRVETLAAVHTHTHTSNLIEHIFSNIGVVYKNKDPVYRSVFYNMRV